MASRFDSSTGIAFPTARDFLDEDVGFREEDVLRGASGDHSCDDGPGRIRVELDDAIDLIRFYGAQQFENPSPPVFFLAGDVVEQVEGRIRVRAGYKDLSMLSMQREAASIASRFGRTFVQLARPGTYGSTGSHLHRRRPRELKLVNCAINRMVETFGWRTIDLAGLSGGGHLVACLMAKRNDIRRAVIASGNVCVRRRLELLDEDKDLTGFDDFVDPVDLVDAAFFGGAREVVMLTDPCDVVVPPSLQTTYADRLRRCGLSVDQRFLSASDPNHHILYEEAINAVFETA